MLNLISHQGTATQNHRDASLHTHEDGYDNNNRFFFLNQKITSVVEDVERRWEVSTEGVKWRSCRGKQSAQKDAVLFPGVCVPLQT